MLQRATIYAEREYNKRDEHYEKYKSKTIFYHIPSDMPPTEEKGRVTDYTSAYVAGAAVAVKHRYPWMDGSLIRQTIYLRQPI